MLQVPTVDQGSQVSTIWRRNCNRTLKVHVVLPQVLREMIRKSIRKIMRLDEISMLSSIYTMMDHQNVGCLSLLERANKDILSLWLQHKQAEVNTMDHEAAHKKALNIPHFTVPAVTLTPASFFAQKIQWDTFTICRSDTDHHSLGKSSSASGMST